MKKGWRKGKKEISEWQVILKENNKTEEKI